MTFNAKKGVSLTRNRNCFSLNGYHAHVCFGDRGSAARPVVDQCHLAEDTFFGDSLEHPVAASDLNLAAVDDEHLIATIAFLNDSLSGLERSQFCAGICKQAEINCVRHVPPMTQMQRTKVSQSIGPRRSSMKIC
jgi:hypothetical protein